MEGRSAAPMPPRPVRHGSIASMLPPHEANFSITGHQAPNEARPVRRSSVLIDESFLRARQRRMTIQAKSQAASSLASSTPNSTGRDDPSMPLTLRDGVKTDPNASTTDADASSDLSEAEKELTDEQREKMRYKSKMQRGGLDLRDSPPLNGSHLSKPFPGSLPLSQLQMQNLGDALSESMPSTGRAQSQTQSQRDAETPKSGGTPRSHPNTARLMNSRRSSAKDPLNLTKFGRTGSASSRRSSKAPSPGGLLKPSPLNATGPRGGDFGDDGDESDLDEADPMSIIKELPKKTETDSKEVKEEERNSNMFRLCDEIYAGMSNMEAVSAELLNFKDELLKYDLPANLLVRFTVFLSRINRCKSETFSPVLRLIESIRLFAAPLEKRELEWQVMKQEVQRRSKELEIAIRRLEIADARITRLSKKSKGWNFIDFINYAKRINERTNKINVLLEYITLLKEKIRQLQAERLHWMKKRAIEALTRARHANEKSSTTPRDKADEAANATKPNTVVLPFKNAPQQKDDAPNRPNQTPPSSSQEPTNSQSNAQQTAQTQSQSQATGDGSNQAFVQTTAATKDVRQSTAPSQSISSSLQQANSSSITQATTYASGNNTLAQQQSPSSSSGTRPQTQNQPFAQTSNTHNSRPQSYVQRLLTDMADGKPGSPLEMSARSYANASAHDSQSLHSYESPSPTAESSTKNASPVSMKERRLMKDEATTTSTPDLGSLLNRTKAQAALASLGVEEKTGSYLRSIQHLALEFRSIAESSSNVIAQMSDLAESAVASAALDNSAAGRSARQSAVRAIRTGHRKKSAAEEGAIASVTDLLMASRKQHSQERNDDTRSSTPASLISTIESTHSNIITHQKASASASIATRDIGISCDLISQRQPETATPTPTPSRLTFTNPQRPGPVTMPSSGNASSPPHHTNATMTVTMASSALSSDRHANDGFSPMSSLNSDPTADDMSPPIKGVRGKSQTALQRQHILGMTEPRSHTGASPSAPTSAVPVPVPPTLKSLPSSIVFDPRVDYAVSFDPSHTASESHSSDQTEAVQRHQPTQVISVPSVSVTWKAQPDGVVGAGESSETKSPREHTHASAVNPVRDTNEPPARPNSASSPDFGNHAHPYYADPSNTAAGFASYTASTPRVFTEGDVLAIISTLKAEMDRIRGEYEARISDLQRARGSSKGGRKQKEQPPSGSVRMFDGIMENSGWKSRRSDVVTADGADRNERHERHSHAKHHHGTRSLSNSPSELAHTAPAGHRMSATASLPPDNAICLPAIFLPTPHRYDPRAHQYWHPLGSSEARVTQPPSIFELPKPQPQTTVRVLDMSSMARDSPRVQTARF